MSVLRMVAGSVMASVLLVSGGCVSTMPGAVTQLSFDRAVDSGVGRVPVSVLARHGDFGVGVFSRYDGYLLLVDGRAWRVDAGARLSPAPPQRSVASATVAKFHWDQAVAIRERADIGRLSAIVGDSIGQRDSICALRMRGRFLSVKVAGLSPHGTPCPPLAEVEAKQVPVQLQDVQGTIIGYRYPDWMGGLEAAGYRLFFITDNLTVGGRVLDFVLQEGTVELDACDRLTVLLGEQG